MLPSHVDKYKITDAIKLLHKDFTKVVILTVGKGGKIECSFSSTDPRNPVNPVEVNRMMKALRASHGMYLRLFRRDSAIKSGVVPQKV